MKNLNKNLIRGRLAQSAIEYVMISALLLAAVTASGFMGKMNNAFEIFFQKAKSAMLE